ncbi:hypothetical protein [Heyndrickxia acidicola]|uniref:Zinc-finger NAD-dependent DNA ligase C4-type domain-containing protein n=1 Tax=Heyndrickxia acidicola TaxID=209389 RepID=A0ABU6MFH0_9BACI|nr:hypothetical protein [Heyndrickxia acidicola]MED1203039.1 hypothetical protein [Heyndrickxia acidicola]
MRDILNIGDRSCPVCGQETLIEEGLSTWICLNPDCKEEYSYEELDADTEIEFGD